MTLVFHLYAYLFGDHEQKISFGRPKPIWKITILKWISKAQGWRVTGFV
jgi:hypothetical protein